MNNTHATGAGLGALIGFVASRYGWNVSTDEALTWGAAVAGFGGSLAHLFQPPGLFPRVKAALGLGQPPAA